MEALRKFWRLRYNPRFLLFYNTVLILPICYYLFWWLRLAHEDLSGMLQYYALEGSDFYLLAFVILFLEFLVIVLLLVSILLAVRLKRRILMDFKDEQPGEVSQIYVTASKINLSVTSFSIP